jgi:hypothetical protein
MALTMRPTGLGSGAYQDNVDYNVFSGEWLIGRIYERKGFRMSSVEPRAAIISKRRLATANSGAKADIPVGPSIAGKYRFTSPAC